VGRSECSGPFVSALRTLVEVEDNRHQEDAEHCAGGDEDNARIEHEGDDYRGDAGEDSERAKGRTSLISLTSPDGSWVICGTWAAKGAGSPAQSASKQAVIGLLNLDSE
jgi:hypothetical protein